MQRLLLPIFLFLAGTLPAFGAVSSKDSLRIALSNTIDPAQQIRLYRDMADATLETPESCQYLTQLYKLAQTSGDTDRMMEALTDLMNTYLLLDNTDSARYISTLAHQVAPAKEHDRWCCLLSMRLFNKELLGSNAENAINDKITEIRNRDIKKESIYARIETEYVLGTTLYDKGQNTEALPHILEAYRLSRQLPPREGTDYQLFVGRQLTRIYDNLAQKEKGIAQTKELIGIKEHYYNEYIKTERPYYSLAEFYITNYASLMINAASLPEEEALFYLRRLNKLDTQTNSPFEKYSCFMAAASYYLSRNNRQKALINTDSLLHYAGIVATYNLPGLYKNKSEILEELGRPGEALVNLRESHRLQDSIQNNNMQEQLNMMRVEYDVNRLNFENAQLEMHNKHILIIALLIGLVLIAMVCAYLYTHLKREQQMKAHMQLLKNRAEESEKLKTAFINSICHEIRTPLNGIVGFSNLLADPLSTPEERIYFPLQIQRNTAQLISLLDSMLEVSTLDVSDEKLECTPTDITGLCRTEFDHHVEINQNKAVENILDIPESPLVIPTNERYLRLVIENLLNNADKFTDHGSITLRCACKDGLVEISVTDTGCGIPPEMQQAVFDRFTKLNTYKQGSGLGLYLCKLIIRRLSGRIFISPDHTNGTHIVVVLPTE